DGLRSVLGLEVGDLHAEEVAHLSLYLVDGDDLFFFAPEVGQHFLRELDTHLAAGQSAEGDHPRERPFELTDVRLAAAVNGKGDVVVEEDALERRLLAQDRYPCFEVGGLDVGN